MFHHSIRVPRHYKVVANIIKKVSTEGGSVKTLLYDNKLRHFRTDVLYALVTETIKHATELDKIFEECNLFTNEPRLDPWLAKVLTTELLYGKRSLPGKSKPEQTILSYKDQIQKYASDNQSTLKTEDNRRPRYVRINTNLLTTSDAIRAFQDEGYKFIRCTSGSYDDYLKQIQGLTEFDFTQDYHVKTVFVFAPGTKLHEHDLYLENKIILQDKATAMAVHLLAPPPGSVVMDLCAAPGNKTTQLAAFMRNQGKIYAIERKEHRYKTLCDFVEKTSSTCVETLHGDSLELKGGDYDDVEYILLDPSCSGSAMAVHLLAPPPGSVVMDLCAAPGNKTTQLAAFMRNQGKIYAIERKEHRYKTLCDFVEKTSSTCVETLHGDSLELKGGDYDDVEYILLDPSCSGSGMTLSVHNYVDENRLAKLTSLQEKFLKHAMNAFPNAKKIVYSTCSLFPEENERVITNVVKLSRSRWVVQDVKKLLKDQWNNIGSGMYGSIGTRCIYARPESDLTTGFFLAVLERDKKSEKSQNNYEPVNNDSEGQIQTNTKIQKKKKLEINVDESNITEENNEEYGAKKNKKHEKKKANENEKVNIELKIDAEMYSKEVTEKKKKKKKHKNKEKGPTESLETSIFEDQDVNENNYINGNKTKKKQKKTQLSENDCRNDAFNEISHEASKKRKKESVEIEISDNIDVIQYNEFSNEETNEITKKKKKKDKVKKLWNL